jgi:hypothetical protein
MVTAEPMIKQCREGASRQRHASYTDRSAMQCLRYMRGEPTKLPMKVMADRLREPL